MVSLLQQNCYSMNKSQIWAASGVILTLIACIIGGWVQINSRIAVLEVQVQNDHEMFMSQSKKIDEINSKIDGIRNDLIEMKGDMRLKQDKFKMQPYDPQY